MTDEETNDKMEPTVGRPEAYPWDKWLDGGVYVLESGKDFLVPVASFRTAMWQAARRRGLKVRTLLVDASGNEAKDDIQFWAFKENK